MKDSNFNFAVNLVETLPACRKSFRGDMYYVKNIYIWIIGKGGSMNWGKIAITGYRQHRIPIDPEEDFLNRRIGTERISIRDNLNNFFSEEYGKNRIQNSVKIPQEAKNKFLEEIESNENRYYGKNFDFKIIDTESTTHCIFFNKKENDDKFAQSYLFVTDVNRGERMMALASNNSREICNYYVVYWSEIKWNSEDGLTEDLFNEMLDDGGRGFHLKKLDKVDMFIIRANRNTNRLPVGVFKGHIKNASINGNHWIGTFYIDKEFRNGGWVNKDDEPQYRGYPRITLHTLFRQREARTLEENVFVVDNLQEYQPPIAQETAEEYDG